MIEMEYTNEQMDLLKAISNDKFSIGAFSGMIFNDVSKLDNWTIEAIDLRIQLALNVRLRIVEVTK